MTHFWKIARVTLTCARSKNAEKWKKYKSWNLLFGKNRTFNFFSELKKTQKVTPRRVCLHKIAHSCIHLETDIFEQFSSNFELLVEYSNKCEKSTFQKSRVPIEIARCLMSLNVSKSEKMKFSFRRFDWKFSPLFNFFKYVDKAVKLLFALPKSLISNFSL